MPFLSASIPPIISILLATTSSRSSVSWVSHFQDFLLALFWLFLGALVLHIDVGGVMSAEYSEQPMSLDKLRDMWQHFWPAAVILGLASTAQMQRIMRSSMLDTMNQQFITTARAKGLKERTVVNRYGVRVAINPMISVLALEIPKIISSSALVGIVLSLPTTGPLFLRALADPGHVFGGHVPALHGAAADGVEPVGGHRAGLGRSEDCLRMSTSVESQDLYDLYRDLDARLQKERYAELESWAGPRQGGRDQVFAVPVAAHVAQVRPQSRRTGRRRHHLCLLRRRTVWQLHRALYADDHVSATASILRPNASISSTRAGSRLLSTEHRPKLDIETFEQITVTDYDVEIPDPPVRRRRTLHDASASSNRTGICLERKVALSTSWAPNSKAAICSRVSSRAVRSR